MRNAVYLKAPEGTCGNFSNHLFFKTWVRVKAKKICRRHFTHHSASNTLPERPLPRRFRNLNSDRLIYLTPIGKDPLR